MPEPFEAKVRVVNTSGQIANVAPVGLQQADIDKITEITKQVVANFQNNLRASAEKTEPHELALSEIELTFGIDFGFEAKAQVKVPIIGPVVGGGINAGATFQVHIKLSRDVS